MGGFSDYLENKVLDHIFGGGDYSRAATVHVGLSTTTVKDDGTGITEPSGGGYARAAVTNNAVNFPAASNGSISNGAAINFPTPTAGWGAVVDFFIADAASGSGNILAYGPLEISKTINTGDVVNFQPGELIVTLD